MTKKYKVNYYLVNDIGDRYFDTLEDCKEFIKTLPDYLLYYTIWVETYELIETMEAKK